MNSYGGGATSASGVVVVFRYKARVVLFAVGMGAFAEPVFMSRVVTVLAFGEEAALLRLVPALPTPLAICLRGAGLFLPGVIPDVQPLLNMVSREGRTWPLVIDNAWCYTLVSIGGS